MLEWTAISSSITCSVQFSSVTQLCLTLCDPTNRSTPGLPVHHKLPEYTQTHAHRVSDAIQPSHPLPPPSPFAFSLSQRQGVFQWVGTSASATVLPMNVQGWLPLGWTGLISLLSKGLSRVFSSTTVCNTSGFSLLYGPILISTNNYWKNHSFNYMDLCHQNYGIVGTAERRTRGIPSWRLSAIWSQDVNWVWILLTIVKEKPENPFLTDDKDWK